MRFFGGEEGARGMEFGCRRYLNCRWVWASKRNVLLGMAQHNTEGKFHNTSGTELTMHRCSRKQRKNGCLLLGYRDLSTGWILTEIKWSSIIGCLRTDHGAAAL
jgi:hypothetical protein